MFRIIFFISALAACFSTWAQDPSVVPELKKELSATMNDTLRVQKLWQICFNSSRKAPAEGIQFGYQALDLATRVGYQRGIGDAHNSIGFCFTNLSGYDSAESHYDKALQVFEKMGNKCYQAAVLSNKGWNFQYQKEYVKALEYFLKGIDFVEGCDDKGFNSSHFYNVGVVYNAMERHQEAIPYFLKAYGLDSTRSDSTKMAISANGLANAYSGQHMYPAAELYYQKAAECLATTGDDYGRAYVFEGLAIMYQGQKQFPKSIEACKAALEIFRVHESPADIVFESTLLAAIYSDAGNMKEAEKWLLETLPLTFQIKAAHERVDIYKKLSEVYKTKKDLNKAYLYLDKYVVLRDSLNVEEQQNKVAELTAQFESEKKDKQILLEQQQTQLKAEEAKGQKLQKYGYMAGAIFFGLLALVLINRYIANRRTARELEAKNALIEKEKERAERSERFRQEFLANMSHELRTPVNVISGLTNLLQKKNRDESEQRYLEAMRSSADSLLVVINDVLDLSKIEAGKMEISREPYRLKEQMALLAESFQPRAKEKGLVLRQQVESSVPEWVRGDLGRIKQILINLLGNAVKFTTTGFVELNVRNEKDEKGEEWIRFEVKDTGKGIEPDQLERIFESFIQAEHTSGGTGLGLTISRQLAGLMGGSIQAVSTPGQGSAFSLVVPFEEADGNREGAILAKGITPELIWNVFERLEGKPILVVDDQAYNRLLLRDTLLTWWPGAKIHEAEDGSAAIEKLKAQDCALVFMDLRMPGIDGFETTRRLRDFSQSKVIAVSADTRPEERERCIEAGMQGFVMKPYRENDLMAELCLVFGLAWEALPEEAVENAEWKYLQRFCRSDKQRIKKYLDILATDVPALLSELEDSIRKKNWEGCRRISHKLAPQAEALDMVKIASSLREWESAGDEQLGVATAVLPLIRSDLLKKVEAAAMFSK